MGSTSRSRLIPVCCAEEVQLEEGRGRVEERFAELDRAVPLQGLLGYLNFAAGKPDARFEKQLNDLKTTDSSAFRDVGQAEAVLPLVFTEVLPAYRAHHADLLFHLNDAEL